MSVTRRNVIKLGLSAGAASLLDTIPVSANAAPPSASATAAPGIPLQRRLTARPLPLHGIRLLGGPLKRAQDADIGYLLQLEPDRMLAYYRQTAGLAPKAKPYGGWDGGGRNLTGHIAGHYLSAISAMWAATGDARFRDRADYIVAELEAVQNKHGDGYLCALEGGRKCFAALEAGQIKSSSFDLNGEWSPWYTLHKTFAGLRDAYRFTGSRKALGVETRFAEWAHGILAGLTQQQIQQMLNTEYGGMNEVLVDLYADTGDPRWLELSYDFEQHAFIDPLQRHQDDLGGKHVNMELPKLIGSAERYVYTQRPADLMGASFAYDAAAQHHSFSTGGMGTDEYFGPADHIGDRIDGRTAESCNVYNMLKMSRQLFSLAPDAHYADEHERLLFNHAMASFDPDAVRMCYMVPVGQGVTHEYQDMFQSFTCCVGTGMENHALAGDGMYYENGDKLWVNIYAPSTAEWPDAGVRLAMESDFPIGETAKLTVRVRKPREFTVAMRRPYWVGDGFAVRVNGSPVEIGSGPYVEVHRTWHTGDTVEVALPKTLRLEATPDMPTRVAIMWGPLVLAGDLGPEPTRRRRGSDAADDEPDGAGRPGTVVPIFVAAEKPVTEWVQPAAGQPGRFRTVGVGREPNAAGAVHEVDLVPFYTVHQRTYSTYWDLVTPAEWSAQQAGYVRDAERLRAIEAATVAFVHPGESASEQKFNLQTGGKDVTPVRVVGRAGRAGRSWFSYDLPAQSDQPLALLVTYYSADRRSSPASFQILVDGHVLADQHVERTDPGRFYDVRYDVPAGLVQGRDSLTIKFQADDKSQIAAIFGVRLIRAADAP
jgi:DUF1680 family protein